MRTKQFLRASSRLFRKGIAGGLTGSCFQGRQKRGERLRFRLKLSLALGRCYGGEERIEFLDGSYWCHRRHGHGRGLAHARNGRRIFGDLGMEVLS